MASDLSEGLNAAGWLVAAISLLISVLLVGRRLRHLSADVRGVKVSVDTGDADKPLGKMVKEDIKPSLDDVSFSVNHKEPHELPLVKRVGVLERNSADMMRVMTDGHRVILSRLDGLEKAARVDAGFRRELVKQLGLDIKIPEERTPT